MTEKKSKTESEQGGEEEKIYFSEVNFACFACGEKVEKNTKTCPYCGTELDNLKSNSR